MDRRRFILAAASAGVATIAGCTGDDGGGNGDGGNGDGGNGDSSGNGDDMANGDDGGNGDDMANGDDGGNGDDGSANGDDMANGDDGGNGGTGDGPALGENYRWEDSFIADMEFETPEMGTTSATLRYNGGNFHNTFETEQGTVEIYQVDDDFYLVQQGQCIKNPGQNPTAEPPVAPEEQENVGDQYDGLTPEGRTTIDGEEVWEYEVENEGEVVTWYVSVETGYITRVEFQQGTIDYHSWGDVDPIEAPDADCQEIGGGGNGGGGGDY
jgi:hypothetical protein